MAHKRLVTRTPDGWRGAILDAVTGFAGRSIIIDGAWYRFRRGSLIVSPACLADRPNLHIQDAGETVDSLDHLIGTRWSILTNCITSFSPHWGSAMSAVSPSDRRSVARSVVLSVVSTLAVLVALAFGAEWWVEAKIQRIEARMETMQRANAAY